MDGRAERRNREMKCLREEGDLKEAESRRKRMYVENQKVKVRRKKRKDRGGRLKRKKEEKEKRTGHRE